MIIVEKKQSQTKKASFIVSPFQPYYFTWRKKQTRFVESSDNDIKKLILNTVPEGWKNLTKYAVNTQYEN